MNNQIPDSNHELVLEPSSIRTEHYASPFAVTSLLISAVITAAWLFELYFIEELIPNFFTTKFNTSVILFLLSLAVYMKTRNLGSRFRRITNGLALAILAFASITVFQDFYAKDFGIDQAFWKDVLAEEGSPSAGRMSPITAASAIFLSLSLILVGSTSKRQISFAHLSLMIVFTIAIFALLGRFFQVQIFYQPLFGSQMGPMTALCFALLCLSIFAAKPQMNWLQTLLKKDAGGYLARRMMGVILVLFPVFSWIRVTGENMGVLSIGAGASVEILLCLFLIFPMVIQTARKLSRQQAAIAFQKARAEEASQLKTMFLANMSHEIRTPLGAILGFTELLKAPQIPEEDKLLYIDTIGRNGKALNRIIDDVLDISKVEAGRLQIEIQRLSLKGLLAEVQQLFREEVRRKGLRFEMLMDEMDVDWICSDPVRIRQILINLVGNAVKFTDQGFVQVQCKSEMIAQDRTRLNFRIHDSGPGLNKEQQGRLFQPFSQAESSTTRKYGGTGLGLVLSQKFAQALGGDVSIAHCTEGEGCIFLLVLEAQTLAPPEASVVSKPTSEAITPLESNRILLVEDAPDNQLLVSRILTRAGAEVDLAANGREGVSKALAGDYHAVLMDIQMPEVDGLEATRRLRKAGFNKPIVALTAHAMVEERRRTMEAGCTAHLTKPLNPAELISTLEELCSSSSAKVLAGELLIT